jgi:putative membrane protein
MMYHGYYWWGMGWFWGFIPWILVLVWIFSRRGRYYGGWKTKYDSPLDILQKRYASGEINAEEYQERKKVLEAEMKK